MKTNKNIETGSKSIDQGGKNAVKNTFSSAKPIAQRGRGRKKIADEDKFADLNMGWEGNAQNFSSGWTGSTGRRKNYSDDAESDSYEGTGYTRSRMHYGDDEDYLNNDPFESFRRG